MPNFLDGTLGKLKEHNSEYEIISKELFFSIHTILMLSVVVCLVLYKVLLTRNHILKVVVVHLAREGSIHSNLCLCTLRNKNALSY